LVVVKSFRMWVAKLTASFTPSSRQAVSEHAQSTGVPGARFVRDGVDQRVSRPEGPCVCS
jgi:hypothetical protein